MNQLHLFILCSFVIISCEKNQTASFLNENSSDLKAGTLVGRRKLNVHSADTFKVDLAKDAFVFGYVDQHDVDVIVEIYDPKHHKVAGYDSPARGFENFRFTTDTSGIFKIAVVPFKDKSGEYSIMLRGAEAKAIDPAQRLEQTMKAIVGDGELTPGAAIAVQRDGETIYSNGFGYADIEQHAKVTPSTIFHVASVSKQFTAFAIGMLADQGKLSLDDDIRKYLPELHDFGTKITIDHLVHHTSGLRDQWSLLTMAGWRMDDVITMNQIMRLVSRQRELNFKPGDEMVYCNTGFTLMAEIVSRVTKVPFRDWCKQNIFEPLGMKNTQFYDDHERIVENRAYSYHLGSSGYKKSVLSYANAGATSLFTTADDLNIWARNFETVKVGNANVMSIMNRKFVLNNGDTSHYAFGHQIEKYRGLNIYGHSGGDAGFRSYLMRFPDQHLSIAVVSNMASFNPGEISYMLADMYLEKEFKSLPKEERPTTPPEERKPAFDPSTVALKDFEGKFYSPELETTYTFRVTNDTLTAYHQRHDDMKLTATAVDEFDISILGTLTFTRDKGAITGFKASNGRVRNLMFIKQ